MRSVLLASLLLTACATAVTGPVAIRSVDVEDVGPPVQVDLSYEAKGNRKVDVVVRLVNTGIEESEKIVANIQVKGGFDIDSGATRWEGFVRPRQPETHTAHLIVAEDFETADCQVTVVRSQDSKMLVMEDLSFSVGADGQVKAGGE